jgi:hypothetical protein
VIALDDGPPGSKTRRFWRVRGGLRASRSLHPGRGPTSVARHLARARQINPPPPLELRRERSVVHDERSFLQPVHGQEVEVHGTDDNDSVIDQHGLRVDHRGLVLVDLGPPLFCFRRGGSIVEWWSDDGRETVIDLDFPTLLLRELHALEERRVLPRSSGGDHRGRGTRPRSDHAPPNFRRFAHPGRTLVLTIYATSVIAALLLRIAVAVDQLAARVVDEVERPAAVEGGAPGA